MESNMYILTVFRQKLPAVTYLRVATYMTNYFTLSACDKHFKQSKLIQYKIRSRL
jgi:hypothetical protein